MANIEPEKASQSGAGPSKFGGDGKCIGTYQVDRVCPKQYEQMFVFTTELLIFALPKNDCNGP